jgi:plasmid stabilization system protein ParE
LIGARLRDIARYTLRTWGRKLRDAYLREMGKRFALLAENPPLGKPRPDIKEGHRRVGVGPVPRPRFVPRPSRATQPSMVGNSILA